MHAIERNSIAGNEPIAVSGVGNRGLLLEGNISFGEQTNFTGTSFRHA